MGTDWNFFNAAFAPTLDTDFSTFLLHQAFPSQIISAARCAGLQWRICVALQWKNACAVPRHCTAGAARWLSAAELGATQWDGSLSLSPILERDFQPLGMMV